jgi:hypothetical protein
VTEAMAAAARKMDTLSSQLYFLARDERFRREKPYILRFEPADGFPANNTAVYQSHIALTDIRSEPPRDYKTSGIDVISIATRMMYEDFDLKTKICDTYLPELQATVRRHLNAKDVIVIPHIVELPAPHYEMFKIRRQPKGFPRASGDQLEHEVPATVVHIDASQAELEKVISACGIKDTSRSGGIEWVNSWAPLRGPVMQWPLGVCDNTSVSVHEDLETTDLVYSDSLHREFLSVYESPRQKWYYLSEQMPHEHLLFRQASLFNNEFVSGVPHASISINNSASDTRESIEVKLLVIY